MLLYKTAVLPLNNLFIFSFHAQVYLDEKKKIVLFGGLTSKDNNVGQERSSISEILVIDPFSLKIQKMDLRGENEIEKEICLTETTTCTTSDNEILFFGGYRTKEVFQQRNLNRCLGKSSKYMKI